MLSIEYQEEEKKLFTADYAIEVANTEDAERISFATALRIVEDHCLSINDFLQDTGADANSIDAGNLFIWLGY